MFMFHFLGRALYMQVSCVQTWSFLSPFYGDIFTSIYLRFQIYLWRNLYMQVSCVQTWSFLNPFNQSTYKTYEFSTPIQTALHREHRTQNTEHTWKNTIWIERHRIYNIAMYGLDRYLGTCCWIEMFPPPPKFFIFIYNCSGSVLFWLTLYQNVGTLRKSWCSTKRQQIISGQTFSWEFL